MAHQPATTVLRIGDRPVAIEVRGYRLDVEAGPSRGASYVAARRSVLIGSQGPCELVLDDPHVSRMHSRIDLRDGGCVLTDLGSTNGTKVAGVRVREALLDDGAAIEIGTSIVRFHLRDEPLRVDLSERDEFEGLLGRSLAMRELFALCERIAPTDAPVLIEGETGTGKERVARALHARSRRAARPFAVFDCAAVPPTLIESELFGHEKGAFTGATDRRAGVFERAAGGTVLLDELGELSLDLQPKLLRVLEANEVWRVGAQKPTPIDARVLAATHRDLAAKVADATFRADLYYRLAVALVKVPPLRDRAGDIPLLAAHFARNHLYGGGAAPRGPGWEAIFASLTQHDWPGNVRELRNVVERAVILSDPKMLADPLDAVKELHSTVPRALARRVSLRAARNQTEREYLEDLLRAVDGDLDQAATIAEVHRKSLERLLRKHRIR
jgi:DNA-binding NtrC family response regulator